MEPVGAGAGGGSDPGLINGFVDRLLSIKAYAAREGISLPSLYYHHRRAHGGAKQGSRHPASSLVAAQLAEPAAMQPCTVWLAPGIRMEFAAPPSPQWLGQLVASLDGQGRSQESSATRCLA